MFRRMGLGLFVALAACSSLSAQDWALKMFETTSHDFGTVAAGAKAEHEFVLKNIYLEDVHIASVTASCGCTIPSVRNDTLKTYQKGAVVATFNTAQFQGARGATLTVVFDRPYPAVVQLQVTMPVLRPGAVFGW